MTAPTTDRIPLLDVSGLPAPEQHAAVLAQVAGIIDGYTLAFGSADQFAGSHIATSIMGRRALLKRHRPVPPVAAGDAYHCAITGAPWPCLDYTDIAGGLVDGLPKARP